MKSLGKHKITVDNFLNGEPTISMTDERTVYEKRDGTYWVNHLDGKRQIELLPSGVFYHRFDVRTIAAHTFEDIIKGRAAA